MADKNNSADDDSQVRESDIVFECPDCGNTLMIDYRGAGLQVQCSECGATVLVPIPEGMQLGDLDLEPGEILKQLFATRANYQKLERQMQALRERMMQMLEALQALEQVAAEGLAES